ncbi:MAG: hypothetical protein ACI3ZY_12415 [Parabacteroides sp.]
MKGTNFHCTLFFWEAKGGIIILNRFQHKTEAFDSLSVSIEQDEKKNEATDAFDAE